MPFSLSFSLSTLLLTCITVAARRKSSFQNLCNKKREKRRLAHLAKKKEKRREKRGRCREREEVSYFFLSTSDCFFPSRPLLLFSFFLPPFSPSRRSQQLKKKTAPCWASSRALSSERGRARERKKRRRRERERRMRERERETNASKKKKGRSNRDAFDLEYKTDLFSLPFPSLSPLESPSPGSSRPTSAPSSSAPCPRRRRSLRLPPPLLRRRRLRRSRPSTHTFLRSSPRPCAGSRRCSWPWRRSRR